MAEIFRKVQPYEFNYVCDQCLRGMMQATGKMMQGGIEHQCMICSHKQLLAKSYPHVEYFAEQESPDWKAVQADKTTDGPMPTSWQV